MPSPRTASELIASLQLAPALDGVRGAGTCILYLLDAGERSHWHQVDASELWIFQSGTPLCLSVAEDRAVRSVQLGIDVAAGEQPQHLVRPHEWQAAEAGAGWCLVACVVVPAFRFEGFELAPADWRPDATG